MDERDSRLTLLRELSRSGIATVWEAYDPTLDRKVLLKSINPQYARESDLRVRFEREARAIARLSHPNVVQIYDLRASADDLSIILEFIEGATLGKLLKDHGSLPCEVAVTIAGEILSGLEHAHAAGIIHRDLKPDNVLVSVKGEVKITDFGLATLRDQPTVTQEGMVIGTPSYMAPEQAGGGEITVVTDVFAVGLILFEMLTGRRVHEGASLAETFQNVLRYRLAAIRGLSRGDPRGRGSGVAADARPPCRPSVTQRPPKPARPCWKPSPRVSCRERLIADFLSGEPIHRPTARAAARTRKWAHPLRAASIAILAIIGVVLVYYFSMVLHTPVETHLPLVLLTPDTTALRPEPSLQPPDTSAPDTARAGEPERPPHQAPGGYQTARFDRDGEIGYCRTSAAATEPGYVDISCRPWASVYLAIPSSAPRRCPLP